MNRFHIAVVAVLLALAAAFGTLAATRTVGLGAASHQATNNTYTARVHRLNAFEAKLRRELAAAKHRRTPPAKVVYHRPPAVVVVRHTQHGDDDFENEGGDD